MNTPIQMHRFHDGGYVLHKITLPNYVGHFSAWCTAFGKLIDAEQYRTNERTWHIRGDSPMFRALEELVIAYRNVVK